MKESPHGFWVKRSLLIYITHNKVIKLDQSKYIADILRRFDRFLNKNQKNSVPMIFDRTNFNKPATDEDLKWLKDNNASLYELCGSILYLSINTRPDIATAVGILARYMSRPTKYLFLKGIDILYYLRNTIDDKLSITAYSDTPTLTGYCDANYADNACSAAN